MKRIILLLIFYSSTISSFSQCLDSLKSVLIKDWERAKDYTREYLAAMPKEKYDFRSTEKTRSFAEQMLHLAKMNFIMVSFATGEKTSWRTNDFENRLSAKSADSVVYFVSVSYDFVIANLKQLDAEKLVEKNKIGPFDLFRFDWFLKAFEHQTHHRGQTTVYLRLAGVTPPEEKLL